MSLNDERTISAIRHRDESAINEVIKKYSKLLWSVSGAVLSGIGSTQDVEECVGGIFSVLTALKILAIRQDCCGFLPCRT